MTQALTQGQETDSQHQDTVERFKEDITNYQTQIEQLEIELRKHSKEWENRNSDLISEFETTNIQSSSVLKERLEKIQILEESIEQIQSVLLVAQNDAKELEERVLELTETELKLRKKKKKWSTADNRIKELEASLETLESVEPEVQSNVVEESLISLEIVRDLKDQRTKLLEERDALQEIQVQQEQRLKELNSSSDDTLIGIQDQRDDAMAELEMVQLELGIVQSTSRQIALQAEQIRDRAINNEARWKRQLTEKESEIIRLRDTLQRMEHGLSAVFVKHPHM